MGIVVGRFTLNVYGIILSQGVCMSSNEVRNVSIIKQHGQVKAWCSCAQYPNCVNAGRK